MNPVLTAVAAVCALLALAGAAYFALCIWAAGRFRRQRGTSTDLQFRASRKPLEIAKGTRSSHVRSISQPLRAGLRRVRVALRRERPQRSGTRVGDAAATGISHAAVARDSLSRDPRTQRKGQQSGSDAAAGAVRTRPDQRQRHRGAAGLFAPGDERFRRPASGHGDDALPRPARKDPAVKAGSSRSQHRLHGRRAGGARDGGRRPLCPGRDHCDDKERVA